MKTTLTVLLASTALFVAAVAGPAMIGVWAAVTALASAVAGVPTLGLIDRVRN